MTVLALQREYFRTRSTEKLRECKNAERRLAEAAEEILNPKSETAPLPFFAPDYGGEG